MSNNKSKKFACMYTIKFSGISKIFPGDKFSFQEKFINDVITSILRVLKIQFKTLKITCSRLPHYKDEKIS